MEDYTKDNGIKRQGKEMELVYNSGLTEANMKVYGEMAEQMVKVE